MTTDPTASANGAAPGYDLEAIWKALADPGRRREFVRLSPVPDIPVTLAAHGEGGWELHEREVLDLSLGGVALVLGPFEARRVRVGELARLYLTLGDHAVNVHGRVVRLHRLPGVLVPRYVLGIEFVGDASLQRALPYLVDTLVRLNDALGHPYARVA